MVKKMAGLPEGYDLKVTPSELLDEPVTLAGYLDEKPSFVKPVQQMKVEPKQEVVAVPEKQVAPTPLIERVVQQVVESKPLHVVEGKAASKKPREKILRLQINMTAEIEKKTQELVELVSRQSPDGRVTISELMQALILNLYDARSDINGRLPQRGRWGTASAKSYPAELAMVLRDAICSRAKGKGEDSFKSAIGS